MTRRLYIWDAGRQKHLGSFGSSHDAARAYDKARPRMLARGAPSDVHQGSDCLLMALRYTFTFSSS